MALTNSQYQQLHGVIELICGIKQLCRSTGDPTNDDVNTQPIFAQFEKIFEEIPVLKTQNDINRFASRCRSQSLTWQSSIREIEKAMDGPEQLAIQKLVYNLKHHAAEVKNQFQKELDEEMDVEGTALIFNLLDLLQSGSIDAQKMAEHDRFSGNQFCKARYEGGVAALKARDDKARYSRVTADPTYPAQLQIKKAWRQAVATPGAYDGVKATFAREMLEKALPFIITERRVIDWTRKWGGKLQKQDKREIQQHSRVHSRCLLASQKTS